MTTYIELPLSSGGLDFVESVTDTNSIDLTVVGTDLSADLRLSGTAAGAGFLKITNSIDAGGLLSLVPEADTNTTGVLTDTDWDKFNDGVTPITDGSTPGAGEIGETLTVTTAESITNTGTTNNWGFGAQLAVTAGIWEISGVAIVNDNNDILSGTIDAGITDSATAVGINVSRIARSDSASTQAASTRTMALQPIVVSISSTTTYYVNVRMTYSGGNTPQIGGYILARRVR